MAAWKKKRHNANGRETRDGVDSYVNGLMVKTVIQYAAKVARTYMKMIIIVVVGAKLTKISRYLHVISA
jgi:hypothetical protein